MKIDEDKMSYVQDLPGFDRGHPHYFKDPTIDHLLEIVLLLGGEVWINRDRQIIMEHLLATQGKVTNDMIEEFRPDEDLRKSLADRRNEFTRRVFGCLYAGLEGEEDDNFFNFIGKED